ncbi:hypothetical protein, partial [Nostoc sp. MG11]|uniref:hypothetical protein n=1 Tax=Nostoc sp. MG11 TaxID=2721166 RepID=UPI0018681838
MKKSEVFTNKLEHSYGKSERHKTPNLNTVAPYLPTPQEQIKALKMHLSLPWKEAAKTWARQELERLLAKYKKRKDSGLIFRKQRWARQIIIRISQQCLCKKVN